MKYLIDAGSSSFKVYKWIDGTINLIEKKTYKLTQKITGDEKKELYIEDKKIIIELLQYLVDKYQLTKYNTRIYATGHFRDFVNISDLTTEIFCLTHLNFFVISQDLETFYQDVKFMPYSKYIGRTMVISIGGGSIQISFYENGEIAEKPIELMFGTNAYGENSKDYFYINNVNSSELLHKIINEVEVKLSETSAHIISKYPIAIFSGGEKTFMELLHYPLKANTLLKDEFHPYMISSQDYYLYNEHIFKEMTIGELIGLMPDNPGWMRGARPYSAIAQAICLHFGVEKIIPSDCNIMDGIIQQEFRRIVICGSFSKQLNMISEVVDRLRKKGIAILSPRSTEIMDVVDGYVIFKGDKREKHCKYPIEQLHLNAIKSDDCDAIIVCNYDNYIGRYTSGEIFVASDHNKKIIFLEANDAEKDFDIPCDIGLIGYLENEYAFSGN